MKAREAERARIRQIRSKVESQLEYEKQQTWNLYLDKREAAKESKYYSIEQTDDQKGKETQSEKIETCLRKVAKDTKMAQRAQKTIHNVRS